LSPKRGVCYVAQLQTACSAIAHLKSAFWVCHVAHPLFCMSNLVSYPDPIQGVPRGTLANCLR